MKRLFILVFVIGLILVSCVNDNPQVYGSTDDPINDSLEAKTGIQSIVHFEYNGHKYIDFREYSGVGSGCSGVNVHSIVHDPDCGCNK